MTSIKGNTTTGIESPVEMQPLIIENFIITNKSNVTITINLSIKSGGNTISICPLNLQLAAGQSYADRNFFLESQETFIFSVSGGSADYYFSINLTT